MYDFYEYKRKHSHKFWQAETLSWLVSLGEEKKKGKTGKKTARPLTWHPDRNGGIFYDYKSLSLNSSPLSCGTKCRQAFGWGVANNVVAAHREVKSGIAITVDVSRVNTGYKKHITPIAAWLYKQILFT